jgi:transposase
LVERVKIVLGCLAGERNDQIASRMKLQSNTVATWRKRFFEGSIKALGERVRSGKPPTYVASDLRERIRKLSNTESSGRCCDPNPSLT